METSLPPNETEVFAPGRPPGYPRGRPQDIRPLTLWAAFSFLTSRSLKASLALPALHQSSVNLFIGFAWDSAMRRQQGFPVNFWWFQCPRKQSTNPRKIRGKFWAHLGAKFCFFPDIALHPNVPSNLVPRTFFKHFQGRKGLAPGTAPLRGTSQQEPCDSSLPSGLVPGTLLWTYFGHSWGKRYRTRVTPGTVPLRNPNRTERKACLENPEKLGTQKPKLRELFVLHLF